jgi:hypothetical protein
MFINARSPQATAERQKLAQPCPEHREGQALGQQSLYFKRHRCDTFGVNSRESLCMMKNISTLENAIRFYESLPDSDKAKVLGNLCFP